ncbi:hypothetical protein QBC39DRAFT_418429, partial [Podospora conica]
GTGHYPAFTGWVGPGLLDGGVTGNIFSSPSASQAVSVAKAADQGGGVLIAFLNYAGDVLHFGQAAERLRADNIEVRTAVVTDDVASAPITDRSLRRGIAGGLAVLKITSAVAEAGLALDDVVEVVNAANKRVRTFGVAFSGCTLPGADHPLFEVPAGQIEVGLGMYGKPGIYETELGTADDMAGLLVDRLLEDRPELYVTYTSVAARLNSAGIEVVEGEVGEFMTSLDIGGVSLTLVWLSQEIGDYYFAECDTAAYKRRAPLAPLLPADVVFNTEAEPIEVTRPGSEPSRTSAQLIAQGLERVTAVIEANDGRASGHRPRHPVDDPQRKETSMAIPGIRGMEHIGFTVPEIDEACAFFIDVLGATELFVDDIDAAISYLRENGVEVLGEPTSYTEGPNLGLTWCYFMAP